MNILSVENLTKAYADKTLFQSVNFGMEDGEKVALVGVNGAGKSTFLKIIANLNQADSGSATLRNGIKLGYLSQDPQFGDSQTIEDCIFQADNKVAQAVKEYEQYLLHPEKYEDKLQHLLDLMDTLNAWDYEAKAKEVLGKLGIHELHLKIPDLSGGQRKRVALAQLLLNEPDLMLIDEPTNHLDIDAVEWLEGLLKASPSAILMITHDRYFLDNVTTNIVEIAENKLYKHNGSYAKYLENKLERNQQARVVKEKAQHLMKKELDWLRKQPQARGTKAKYRINAFDGVKDKATKQIESQDLSIQIGSQRQGKKVLELHNIGKKYGDLKLVDGFSYKFAPGDKVGIVGKNGVGKSTFLNLITNTIETETGKLVYGETTKIGYYKQSYETLNPENRVIEEIREIAEFVTLANNQTMNVSKLLELFLFDSKHQYTYISKLSGGEKRRLQLLKVLVRQPNFLILDEPTNDFDIDTLNVLEDYLEKFTGCLMIVSHDRYFLDKLCDHLFVFEGDGIIRDFPGNYTDFRESQVGKNKQTKSNKTKSEPATAIVAKKEKKGLSYNEKREYEGLEKEIANLEKEKKALVDKLSTPNVGHEQLTEWSLEIEKLSELIDEKSMRWLELDELA